MAAKRPPETPNYSPPVYVAPPLDYLPAGVVAREPGRGEMPPVAVQKARRLTLVDREGKHSFEFSADFGGALVVLEPGKSPDPLWGGGCLGRFSPFVPSMRLEDDPRRLVVVDSDPEQTTRIIPIDELEPPGLIVAWSAPDEREPWVMREHTERFSLGELESLLLEDV